jgi:hypothetical protein
MFKDASSNAGLLGSVRWETPVRPKNVGLKVHRARRAPRGKNQRKTRQVEGAARALPLILPLLLPEVPSCGGTEASDARIRSRRRYQFAVMLTDNGRRRLE